MVWFHALFVSYPFAPQTVCRAFGQAGGPPPQGRCRGSVTQTKVGRARRSARGGSDSDSLEHVAFFLRWRRARSDAPYLSEGRDIWVTDPWDFDLTPVHGGQ